MARGPGILGVGWVTLTQPFWGRGGPHNRGPYWRRGWGEDWGQGSMGRSHVCHDGGTIFDCRSNYIAISETLFSFKRIELDLL